MSEHFFFSFGNVMKKITDTKSKLINCFLFQLTLKGMSKRQSSRRGSLEAYFTVQILFLGVLVMLYVAITNLSHPISPDNVENGKLTVFSPDFTSAPVCCIYCFFFFILFLLWPHIFPIGRCAIIDLFLLFIPCIIVLSNLKNVSENHAFPNNVTNL